ncbi:MAG: 4-hydroxythreonine-4-phosphate dehydrogenase PdxA [Lentisphaerae bacterium]|nr:4-hydroxythreonine-4-phosphate dehydrogenase PdxA [Lentisphaerota bacterium]
MGDPAGIGPEICLHALSDASVTAHCIPIVFGDVDLLRRVAEICNLPAPAEVITESSACRGATGAAVYDLKGVDAERVTAGQVSAATGAAAHHYIEAAIEAAQSGAVDAVCTAPIHKEAFRAAGVPFPGHTELFEARTGATRACMMLTAETITCSLVTTHIGYRDVAAALSSERILDVIELTAEAMRRLRGHTPQLVVCGLNPHAGEHGLFGDGEEERIIAPAIAIARERGLQVEGPLPPDTAFLPQRRKTTDAYICMYHDQGLIPLKMLAFDSAINITLGLPIIRTSVDHGTALDIAWQGRANPNSLFEAIKLAAWLV